MGRGDVVTSPWRSDAVFEAWLRPTLSRALTRVCPGWDTDRCPLYAAVDVGVPRPYLTSPWLVGQLWRGPIGQVVASTGSCRRRARRDRYILMLTKDAPAFGRCPLPFNPKLDKFRRCSDEIEKGDREWRGVYAQVTLAHMWT